MRSPPDPIPPLAGTELAGVCTFRDLADVRRNLSAARPGGRVAVIGGGLLGLEAAAALAGRGLAVTVLHLAGHLMERQLDASAGFLLKRALKARGIQVRTGVQTRALLGHDRVEAVLLEGETVIEADLVVLATGIHAPRSRRPLPAAAGDAAQDHRHRRGDGRPPR